MEMNDKTASNWAALVTCFLMAAIIFGLIWASDIASAKFDADIADATAITQAAVDEQADLTRRYDLAIEFGFNPIIIEIVDNESRAAFKSAKGDEFRLIQTHEYLTHIFLSMIYTESKGVIDARGDKGKAYGLTQIWLSTARDYQPELKSGQLYDPQVNVSVSMEHFRYLLTEYRGNFTLALLAWNRGKAKVDSMIAWGKSPANGYGARVFNASVTATRYNLASRP
jgi:soluble lytic murein transglycosylase-like protein